MIPEDPEALQRRWLERLRSIVTERLGGLPVTVWPFGSRARGDHRPASDVDLAVDVYGPIPVDALVELRAALEESPVPLFCDVVDLRAASPGLRERIRSEGKRWIVSKSA